RSLFETLIALAHFQQQDRALRRHLLLLLLRPEASSSPPDPLPLPTGLKSQSTMGKLQALRNFNAFPHAEDHLLQKTFSGAIVSIVGLTIMVTLFVHELKYYLTTYTVHQMSVDLKRGDTLPIHINMTFPALPCEVLSVDAIDMSGKHEVDLDTNIWKLRLNREGHIIGTEYLSDLVEKEHSTHEHDHGDDHHEDSSQKKQEHTFNSDAEKMIKNVKHAMANSEGCRVYGVLDVQRVAGNFHLSVHGLNIFVAQQIFEGSSHVNVSHIIHDLSFGPKYPGIHNPLDGTTRILHDASGTFKYYIKIVPTEYRYLSKEVLPTNQFSVTEYFLPIRETDRSWPAVYFLYDLSPITVTIREERRSFLHFITRLCAVLGGTFALTGMLDRWMYIIIESVSKSKTRSVLR
ncbi:Endoplasmic reticulum-Golgi intermediate compartment protein 3, partial [Ananas comosus]